MVKPGEAPIHWGFTADRFAADSYLWITGKTCTISFIETLERGYGHFSHLIKAIEADGFHVEVPTPLRQMEDILTRWGFKPKIIWDAQMQEEVKVWERGEMSK